MDRINIILTWAESGLAPAQFDTKFVKSCRDQLQDKGFLSEKQLNALQSIIDKWKIGQDRDDGQRRPFGKN